MKYFTECKTLDELKKRSDTPPLLPCPTPSALT